MGKYPNMCCPLEKPSKEKTGNNPSSHLVRIGNCQTPVLGLGLGVGFTFPWDNNNNNDNNNPHLNFPLLGKVRG